MPLRTKKLREKYAKRCKLLDGSSCVLCQIINQATHSFKHWFIVKNEFPYDRWTVRHDMVIPKRHVANENQLTNVEKIELVKIKEQHLPKEEYDMYIENMPRTKSVKDHFHAHAIVLNDNFRRS